MPKKSPEPKQKRAESGLTRRTFLGMSLATGATLLAGRSATIFGAASSTTPSLATNSAWKLGGDLSVNRLGFGAMRITGEGVWGWPPDRDNALKVLRRAVELGVNLIDTADAYGPETSELLIAEALHPYPAGLVIATKGGLTRPGPGQWVPNGRPEYLKKCVEGSLKRLTARSDRSLSIAPCRSESGDGRIARRDQGDAGRRKDSGMLDYRKWRRRKSSGRAKFLPIVSVQNRYNIANRKWEKTLVYCEKEGLGFMPWSPIGGNRGLKPGDALEAVAKAHGASVIQLALAWLLQRSPVMLPIPGTSSVPHLEENVAAAKIKLTPEEWKTIDALAGPS